MKKNPFSYTSPLPFGRSFQLAWPMILSNISFPLMGLADSAMLGHLDSPQYLAATTLGINILAFVFWIFVFLRMGTTAVVGQAFGAGKPKEIGDHLIRAGTFAIIIAGILLLAKPWLIPFALNLMSPNEALNALANSYSQIRLLSAPAVLITYVIIGALIGLQNTRLPLIIMVSTNVLNVALDYVFIVTLQYHSDGAAIASVISEYTGLFIGLAVLYYYCKKHTYITFSIARIGDSQAWKRLVTLNSNLMVRTGLLLLVFNFFAAQGARLGEEVLAANALLMQCVLVFSFALDGYAHAAETLVAKAVGAKRSSEFMAACIATTFSGPIVCSVLMLTFWSLNDVLLGLLSNIDSILVTADRFIPWLYIIFAVSIWGYMFDGIFIGAEQTSSMRNAMILSVAGVFLPSWWWLDGLAMARATDNPHILPLLNLNDLKNHALWAAFSLFSASRGVFLGLLFYSITLKRQWC